MGEGGAGPLLIESGLAQHRAAVRSAAAALCRHGSETDDLVQDTFERALRWIADGGEPPRAPLPWLISILRHVFIDGIRRGRRGAAQALGDADDHAAPEAPAEPAWAGVSTDDVRRALARLDPELRRAFELHYLEGMRYRDIAVALSIPDNTVASRLYRARKALRQELLLAADLYQEASDDGRRRARP